MSDDAIKLYGSRVGKEKKLFVWCKSCYMQRSRNFLYGLIHK